MGCVFYQAKSLRCVVCKALKALLYKGSVQLHNHQVIISLPAHNQFQNQIPLFGAVYQGLWRF